MYLVVTNQDIHAIGNDAISTFFIQKVMDGQQVRYMAFYDKDEVTLSHISREIS